MEGVVREGKRLRGVHLDARAVASPLGVLRVGIVVPKHGHTAVRRNRLKRQLRELVRLILLAEPVACDLVVRAHDVTYSKTFDDLRGDMERIRVQVQAMFAAATP